MRTRARKFTTQTFQEKMCSRCRKTLPAIEFYPHRRMKSGLQPNCRTCSREWHRERPDYIRRKNAEFKRKNPHYALMHHRKKTYGLTPSDISDLIARQNGICPGCVRSLSEVKDCVDHDHDTGKVRGLICDDCNLVLGRAKDSPETLKRLAAYLEANSSRLEAEDH